MVCTFFGHSDAKKDIIPILRNTIENLIIEQNVKMFLVGNQGNFDYIVKDILKEIKEIYKQIDYKVVLAYIPFKNEFELEDYSDTLYPDGLEKTPLKFAISKRNEWLINESDIVITYVRYCFGGAAKFKELAEKKGKIVINIP